MDETVDPACLLPRLPFRWPGRHRASRSAINQFFPDQFPAVSTVICLPQTMVSRTEAC